MNWKRWTLWLLAALIGMPLLYLFAAWGEIDASLWSHLWETQLRTLIHHSLVLLFGVGAGVWLLGVSNAWLVSRCDYPGRRWFEKLLFLPLALPAYVFAFVYLGLFDFAGPVRSLLRNAFGTDPQWLDPRSSVAVCIILSLAFYPYVYLLARSAFVRQGAGPYETARVLGKGRFGAFWHASLPLARPAIAAGLLLALMEALADFGAVSALGFDTFTTAIYKAWYAMFSLPTAAQLATLLLLALLLLAWAEREQRGRAVYHAQADRRQRTILRGWHGWAAIAWQSLIVLLGLLVPLGQLIVWAFSRTPDWRNLIDLTLNTLLLGLVGGLIVCVIAGLVVALQGRDKLFRTELINAGYALPGTVLAVAVTLMLIAVGQWFGQPALLTGSLLGLFVAYVIRFLRVGYGPIHGAYELTRPDLIETARALGAGQRRRFKEIWLPLLEPGIVAAVLLVAVEIMKEMPATLLLRPFGWDTLAVKIYELTSEGEWQLAALPALLLLVVGLIPAWLLMRQED